MSVRTLIPLCSKAAFSISPAKDSQLGIRHAPRWITVISSVPSCFHAVAISHATTPPPRIAKRRGTVRALVASRLVHGCASARPGTSGIAGRLPVQTATACRAVRFVVIPSLSVTDTRRSPVNLPWPRNRSILASRSHVTWPESSQFEVKESRLSNTAVALSLPVTASRAPFTLRASSKACPGRNKALLGMHAQ